MGNKSNDTTFASQSGVVQDTASPSDSFTSDEVTTLQAIAAEVPNIAISSSSGNFSTTSTTLIDVTNLSVSFTVSSDDSYVEVGLISDPSNSTSFIEAQITSSDNDAYCTVALLRDSTVISRNALQSLYEGNTLGRVKSPVGAVRTIEQPGAGTYTYKVQLRRITSNVTARIYYAKLYVKEIRR